MRELTVDEVEMANGAGYLYEGWLDINEIIRDLPNAYQSAIMSATDMMCIATGRC